MIETGGMDSDMFVVREEKNVRFPDEINLRSCGGVDGNHQGVEVTVQNHQNLAQNLTGVPEVAHQIVSGNRAEVAIVSIDDVEGRARVGELNHRLAGAFDVGSLVGSDVNRVDRVVHKMYHPFKLMNHIYYTTKSYKMQIS